MKSKVERLLSRGETLVSKFQQDNKTKHIEEAIALDRKALDICLQSHPMRSACLTQLSCHLLLRYNQLGEVENVNEAIALDNEALALSPPGNQHRSGCLHRLAHHLWTRFTRLGGMEDLNEAIALDREALTLIPQGKPERSGTLNNLAISLGTRYRQLDGVEDLNEAIILNREALSLHPKGHTDWSMSSNNLAILLWFRYQQLGGLEDLDEATILHRDALATRPPGNADRSSSLNNLAMCLYGRYRELGQVEDLTESIVLDREALKLLPPKNPFRSTSLNNLAIRLFARYKQIDSLKDLNETICLDREALVLHPPGHPDRSSSLKNLTVHLSTRYNRLGQIQDLEETFGLYSELAKWQQAVSSSDLNVGKAWINATEIFCHPTTILAYETTLRLLVHHLAALPSLPQHLGVLKDLTASLAVDAFSACIRNRSPTTAIELLEQGRGVFLSQLTRLRSPLDDVIASGPAGKTFAEEFRRLTSMIRNAFDSPGADQHDRVCRLNLELDRVVRNIRELPGHSRFLLPLLYSNLQCAASGGPVIIVNASEYSCDALIVFSDKYPTHIPLSITKEDVRNMTLTLHGLTVFAKRSNVTKELGVFLRELWDRIVSPIAHSLRTTYPLHSRIWWCPTAEFSLLPLHAAGPYRKGEKNLGDLYISSYTPTLSALIRARQLSSSSSGSTRKRFIAIGQANAKGTSELQCVSSELATIGQRMDSLATFTRIESEEACISRVTEELNENQWVHLACHGLANKKQPLESAFALHDGRLTIQRIIQCDLQNPEFAYLSACHTTVGDEESPDEVIHLASAMQFAGFRSVIGTMWAVDDAETNKITSVFYKHVVDDSGCLDHTRAAYALWKTMKSVRVPLDQRILYIHLGA